METINETTIAEILNSLKEQTSLNDLAQKFLWTLAKQLEASQGAFFITKKKENTHVLSFLVGYAYHLPDSEVIEFEFGEGLSGQVAKEGKLVNIHAVPEGYITILSGLGNATPSAMLIFPIKNGEEVLAVVELASFKDFTTEEEKFIQELAKQVAPLFSNFN
jgi:putative methionine-R-sulfoxide reductase with GAF domain